MRKKGSRGASVTVHIGGHPKPVEHYITVDVTWEGHNLGLDAEKVELKAQKIACYDYHPLVGEMKPKMTQPFNAGQAARVISALMKLNREWGWPLRVEHTTVYNRE